MASILGSKSRKVVAVLKRQGVVDASSLSLLDEKRLLQWKVPGVPAAKLAMAAAAETKSRRPGIFFFIFFSYSSIFFFHCPL